MFKDQKRPDGLTYFSYKAGKPLAWDFTSPCTVAPSNISASIQEAGKTANKAEELKLKKYSELHKDYHVVPVAIETFGSIGTHGKKLIEEIGNMIIEKSGEKRSKFYVPISAVVYGSSARKCSLSPGVCRPPRQT